jgi:hypothetical protein
MTVLSAALTVLLSSPAGNDCRTPILPPLHGGVTAPACEAPEDAEVLQILNGLSRAVPYLCEQYRDDIRIVKEQLVDEVDEPRFFPLVGVARLHHSHWKCSIYFAETIESSYPFSFRVTRPAVGVVYIDKDHLHLCTAREWLPASTQP